MVRRKPLLAVVAVLAALAGCSAGAGRQLAVRPEPVSPPPTIAVDDIIEQTNRNASEVQALYAHPSVSGRGFGRMSGVLEGPLAFQRPHNFKLRLSPGYSSKTFLDVGSNQEEFWFWTPQDEGAEKAIYIGQFGDGGTLPAGLPFQPEWIVESLGLRPISESEAAALRVERGKTPGTIILTHRRDDGRGGTRWKQTVVNEATRQVVRHIYYAEDNTTPVAIVDPSDYRATPNSQDEAPVVATVEIPNQLSVELRSRENPRDVKHLKIQLSRVKINPPYSDEQWADLFQVPQYAGYQPRRISAEPVYAAGGETRSYESRPAPPAGARFGDPEPLGADETSLRRSDPTTLEADLAALPAEPIGASGLVRPGLPHAPGRDVEYETPVQESRRGSLGSGFYR